ncbi:hypothetical protein CXB51_021007 [Gossypium anomalum]|uniref:Uncharacterized protein n=1 Tax=Gossypium anomalum TaxID=47600 RepID=A0A8J6CXP6_9ROSI|nr:hypothetical protein CXB51_021007 [Gossypium anomalum]
MMSSIKVHVVQVIVALLFAVSQLGYGQTMDSSPAPAPGPSNDGAAIDQGIAYMLLLIALAITYLVH